jgi:hypothetical protein
MWVKLGAIQDEFLFGAGASTANQTYIRFYSGGSQAILWETDTSSTTNWAVQTNAVYRDPSAWYHLVFAYDSSLSGLSNQAKIYVNGVQTSVTTSGSGTNSYVNTTVAHYIGRAASTTYFDGYITEAQLIDGQALTPNSFGTTNSYGVWQPITYGGSYGTNGFYLPFTNTTSATTLAYDFSPNGNNWTPNNISVTAGVTYDSMQDVPTLTSATAANYAVINSLLVGDYFASGQTTFAITNGNLNYGATGRNAFGSIAVSSGKWYWEMVNTSNTTAATALFGLVTVASRTAVYGCYYNSVSGNKGLGTLNSGATETSYGATWSDNDVIGVAVDMDAATPTVTFYKNNASQGAISVSSFVGQSVMMWIQNGGNTNNMSGFVNFGQRPFSYTPPTGFVALNTYNLPAGTITTSGSFTGNVSTDGPFVYLNGVPTAMTINGNAVTFGTNADKLANGFKVRSSSSSYNASGSNTYSITTTDAKFKNANAQTNP